MNKLNGRERGPQRREVQDKKHGTVGNRRQSDTGSHDIGRRGPAKGRLRSKQGKGTGAEDLKEWSDSDEGWPEETLELVTPCEACRPVGDFLPEMRALLCGVCGGGVLSGV